MSRGSARSGGIEPYSAQDLVDFYVSLGGEFDSQTGSHRFFLLPTGQRVGAAVGCGDKVTTTHAKHVARTLQMSYADLRAALGCPLVGRGKPGKGTVKAAKPAVTRADVLAELKRAKDRAHAIEVDLRQGSPRDQAYYAGLLPDIAAATSALRRVKP